MSAIADAAATAILHSLWQQMAIALALWVLLGAMHRVSANARYVISGAALVAMVLLPLATFIEALTAAAPSGLSAVSAGGQPLDLPLVMPDGSRIWTDRSVAPPTVLGSLHGWIVSLWMAGALLASIRLVWSAGHVRFVRRSGVPAPGEVLAVVARLAVAGRVRRRIGVIVTTLIESPATVGWLHPVILVPPALLTGLSASQLEAILAHEVAHIRRHDFVVNLLQMAAETLFFYQPAVWWVSRAMRVERELCCDDFAVQTSGNAHDYAHALAAVARHAVTGVAISAGGPSLPYRVRRLLRVPGDSPRVGAGSMAVGVLLLAIAVGIGTWVQAQPRSAARSGELATLSLTVLDPFGQRAAAVPLVFEQGAFQDGAVFGHGFTDDRGRYSVSLPAGTYLFSALIDFFPGTEVTLEPGDRVEREVRMQLEPMSAAFTVCVDCRDSITPAEGPVAQDLQSDRESYAAALTHTAEPAGGWEQYRVDVPASLQQLGSAVAGNVTIAGRVGVDGRLTNLRALSSAHPALSDAALGALAGQRWVPARVRSTPVEIEVLIELQYVWERGQ